MKHRQRLAPWPDPLAERLRQLLLQDIRAEQDEPRRAVQVGDPLSEHLAVVSGRARALRRLLRQYRRQALVLDRREDRAAAATACASLREWLTELDAIERDRVAGLPVPLCRLPMCSA